MSAQCPDGSPPPCRAAPARASPSPTSVAVAYFENLSPDTADAYLTDGLTEEVTARLGQVERLTVKSRAVMRRYRGTRSDPATLGAALRVSHLVNGSVRRGTGRLRVTVELVQAATGDRLWGQTYDSRAEADLLDIQEDIARRVTIEIVGRLLPSERARLARRPTRNPRAYDRFLLGNHLFAQRTPASVLRAIGEYEAALRLDPSFVAARARIVWGYDQFRTRDWTHPTLPRDSLLGRGLRLADEAIRLDSTSADAWIARAMIVGPVDGLPAVERAVALDQQLADAWHMLAIWRRDLGDDAGAVAAFERALTIEPDRVATLAFLASHHLNRRRYGEAARLADSAIAIDATVYLSYPARAVARLYLADTAGALRDAEAARRLSPPEYRLYADIASVRVSAAAGDTALARTYLWRQRAAAGAPATRTGEREVFLAIGWVALGEPDSALAVLADAPRVPFLAYVLASNAFDRVRADPRFQRLVEESRPR